LPIRRPVDEFIFTLFKFLLLFFLQMESYAQLQERNTELEASNAQLRGRNAVLEHESNARAEVNKENDHELDQAKI
jgi:cell shape-determining protein MreC